MNTFETIDQTNNKMTREEMMKTRVVGAKYVLRRLTRNFKVGPNTYLPSGNIAALERELERTVLQNKNSLMEPQTLLEDCGISLDDLLRVSETAKDLLDANDMFIRKIEASLIFMCQLMKSRDWKDALLALSSLIHALQPKSVVGFFRETVVDKFREIFTSEALQEQSYSEDSLDWMEAGLDAIRNKFDFLSSMKDIPIMQKMHKFLLYCMAHSLLDSVGVTFDQLGYDKFESAKIMKAHQTKVGFLFSLFDCLTLFCKQFISSVKMGSFEPFYHSSDTYAAWIDSVITLKRQERFLSNPEPHGFNIFDFRMRLETALEHGVEIMRATKSSPKLYRDRIAQLYSDIRMIKSNDISRRSAQRDRPSPFGVCYYGGSSLGKSTLINITFQYYAARFGYSNDSSSKYTRNPGEAYWNGFTTSQWCIVMDDIAAQNPSLGTEDLSLKEIIGVMNNVAYQPDQAAIEDKGKTPVQAKLVIATTNTENLNAHAYFSCPLAVQRRLPWVIHVTVKDEYATGRMLDHTKAKKVPGRYADYWNITVKRVVPETDDPNNKKGKTEIVHTFAHIDDYLAWFGQTVEVHERVQALIGQEDKDTAKIEACILCSRPKYSCMCDRVDESESSKCWTCELPMAVCACPSLQQQHLELTNGSSTWDFVRNVWHTQDTFDACYTLLTVTMWTYFWWIALMLGWPLTYLLCKTAIDELWYDLNISNHIFGFIMRRLGHSVLQRYRPFIGYAKIFGVMSVSAFLACKVYNSVPSLTKAKDDRVLICSECGETVVLEEQAQIAEIGKKPTATSDEKPNVWYKNDFNVTRFDVQNLTSSWSALPLEKVKQYIRNNCLRVDIQVHDSTIKNRRTGMFALGGQLFAMNSHAIPNMDVFEFHVQRCIDINGVNSNPPPMIVVRSQMYFSETTDIVYVHLRGLPPFKDVSSLIPQKSFNGNFNGYYVGYDMEFMEFDREVMKITKAVHVDVRGPLDYFGGTAYHPTKLGDCGTPMIMTTPHGPVLAGIHSLGSPDGIVAAARFYPEDIERARSCLGVKRVQSGEPCINSESSDQRVIIPLDRKSPFHLDSGSANIYGSLSGNRPSHKSNVDRTCIADSLEKRGLKQHFDKPVMRGWAPWRNAAIDMVKIPNSFREDILTFATSCFTREILDRLPKAELDQVHVYDLFTSINGAAGVSYVDKMNRGTSAGFPWCTSKRKYLHAIEAQNDLPDPVDITPEIRDRVQKIVETYHAGTRWMPIFMANLKDEPTKYSKIEVSKTRVFGGAPMDWSLVNRMYLLPIIRLIQNNRYIFESAPGTIAQSVEWEDMYQYLVHFGTDRIVAGDYKAFDKSMPPMFILAAFDVMMALCEKAGYSEEDLQVVAGLAYDTAFPLFNFNGDLVEFFGSNPSGHPLTVIVNGLANALYMRYCYIVLNPDHDCSTFKENVHLMTYGDDNVMGVSQRASWFNHTAIQEILGAHGVTYTMADKTSASVPFIDISEVSFLKRAWRWDDDLKCHLCPLEYESIEKSLMTCVVSKSVSAQMQAIDIMSSAVNEFFFYGKEVFEDKRQMLLEIIQENSLEIFYADKPFPTWGQIVERFESYPLRQKWQDAVKVVGEC